MRYASTTAANRAVQLKLGEEEERQRGFGVVAEPRGGRHAREIEKGPKGMTMIASLEFQVAPRKSRQPR